MKPSMLSKMHRRNYIWQCLCIQTSPRHIQPQSSQEKVESASRKEAEEHQRAKQQREALSGIEFGLNNKYILYLFGQTQQPPAASGARFLGLDFAPKPLRYQALPNPRNVDVKHRDQRGLVLVD